MFPAAMFVSVADVGVADVGEVRHLRALRRCASFLISTNVPAFGARLEHRAGAKVTERADERAGADRRVDGDRVRADLGAAATFVAPRRTVNGWMTASGSSSTSGSIQVGRGIDDRDAGEHVRLVDAVAQRGGGGGELDARVHALGLDRVGRHVHGDVLAVLDEVADRVGEVQLALRVVRLEPLERGPERSARKT